MVAAVGLVDPLDDFLAPLMLEIDIDVGRLAALLGDEALEQQVVPDRIDRGDAEHVADGELAAEPRPWQRMSWLRAKRTIELTVRKYGA